MIEKKVNLRLDECAFPERIRVSQFDTMWQFVFGILYKSRPWQIPTGATAVLNGRKPDGNVFAFSGTIEDNKVTVDCDVQMTAVAGQTVCELSILSDGKVVGTANFVLDVETAPKSPDDVSSETTLPAYAEILDAASRVPPNTTNWVLYDETLPDETAEPVAVVDTNGTTWYLGVDTNGVPFVGNTNNEVVWVPTESEYANGDEVRY